MNFIPDIADKARRAVRTGIQVALAFGTFAAVYPLIIEAVGAPANSTLGVWLGATVTWVTVAAGIISRIMSIPAVNDVLAKLRLAGHSGEAATDDAPVTELSDSPSTVLINTIPADSGR